jgi:F420-0:gamma-glutamyl ligase
MFKNFSILAVVLCALSFAGTLSADQPTPAPVMHPKSSIISGEAISVNVAAKQIVLNNSAVFDVADKANIRKEGKVITLSDIKIGDTLLIAYKQQNDKKLATAIKVRSSKK